jgi:hypothetical protein
MKRLAIAAALTLLAGCDAAGGTARFLPEPPSSGIGSDAGRHVAGAPRGIKLRLTMSVPRRRRGERLEAKHPATISPATQSLSISMNGGSPQVYNATPTSPGCAVVANGTQCSFVVDAPIGAVSMTVTTYNATGGAGAILDRGTAVVTIVSGKANAPSIVLGPVVSTTADTGAGSLRYAVAGANPGDTIMFVLANGAKIVLTRPITISNAVSIAGPGVSAGITIGAANASQIFLVTSTGTASISGLILTQGYATVAQQPGGAISNAGTLSLTGDTFTANGSIVQSPLIVRAPHEAANVAGRHHRKHPHCSNTSHDGGAVYNNGSLSISGTTFDGNTLDSAPASCLYSRGGAIYNDKDGTLSVDGSVFTSNAAYDGGAIFNNSTYGQATLTNDTFTGNLGCTGTTGCPFGGGYSAAGNGGALYDNDGPGISIMNTTFSQNVVGGKVPASSGQGGALDLNAGRPVITGSTFTSNVAGGGTDCSYGEGGAIQHNAQSLELDDDTFTGNAAGGDDEGEGGAIYVGNPLTGTNDAFTSNSVIGTGSACAPQGEAYGGAIYANIDPIVLTNSSFESNAVTSSNDSEGGAIYANTATLSNDTFTSNTASGTGANNANVVDAYGGAVYVDGTGSLVSSNDTFSSNTAAIAGANAAEADGGAVDDTGTTLSSTHDTFASNVSSGTAGFPYVTGGAISGGAASTIRSDAFTGNAARGPYETYGGAVYSYESGNTISASTFSSNVASGSPGDGGAIYDYLGLTINGSVLSGNGASFAGGGLFADSTDYVYDSTISANVVTAAGQYGGGGGVYLNNASLIENSTISRNTVTATSAQGGGGAIYNRGGMVLVGSTIWGNSALGTVAGSGGGGVFNNNDATIQNTTISGNSSATDGGGFETYDPSLAYAVQLVNVTVFQNGAAGSGGNIDNPYVMSLTNSIVAGGMASAGADIANGGTLASGDYNVIATLPSSHALSGATSHNKQADPQLLALATNGGPTLTNADQTASPGRAMIPYALGCGPGGGPSSDQRGFTRGTGGLCDAGAYEFSGVPNAARRHAAIALCGHPRAKRGRPLR